MTKSLDIIGTSRLTWWRQILAAALMWILEHGAEGLYSTADPNIAKCWWWSLWKALIMKSQTVRASGLLVHPRCRDLHCKGVHIDLIKPYGRWTITCHSGDADCRSGGVQPADVEGTNWWLLANAIIVVAVWTGRANGQARTPTDYWCLPRRWEKQSHGRLKQHM